MGLGLSVTLRSPYYGVLEAYDLADTSTFDAEFLEAAPYVTFISRVFDVSLVSPLAEARGVGRFIVTFYRFCGWLIVAVAFSAKFPCLGLVRLLGGFEGR